MIGADLVTSACRSAMAEHAIRGDHSTGHDGAGHDGAAVPSTLKGAHAHDKEVCEAIQTFVPAQT